MDFEDFARAELPGLLRYAAVLSGDRDLAGDLVQEVLVRTQAKWGRISRVEHPELYVRRMVTNEFLSWRRRWHVRMIRPASREALESSAGQTPDVSAAVVDRDEARTRLQGLPPRQRAILVLRFYEGLSDSEIAGVLGCPAGTVRSAASRALATLRIADGATTPPARLVNGDLR